MSRIKALLKVLRHSVKKNSVNLVNRVQVYRNFGVLIPKSSVIKDIQNISIGKGFLISPNCQVFAQGKIGDALISIGDDVALNYNVMINADCGGKIYFGNDVIIGPYSIFRASGHQYSSTELPISKQGHLCGTITVEDNVWIGARVVVLPNVTIGKFSIIGAGSIVTKDIPPYSVAVGNPAKVIKTRK